jgi:hypothetical protein
VISLAFTVNAVEFFCSASSSSYSGSPRLPTIIDTRYATLSRVIGGVILIGRGVWMLSR